MNPELLVLFLLLMYLSPFVAFALYWRAQSVTASAAGDLDDGVVSAWEVLKLSLRGRVALVRPVAGAAVASTLVVVAADGFSAAAAFAAGVVFGAVFAAVSRSSMLSAVAHGVPEASDAHWVEGSGIALGLASMVAGAVGALAWFFADPSGVVVLVAFLLGTSSTALFVAMTSDAAFDASSAAAFSSTARAVDASVWSASSPMHLALAAVAASLMVAASVESQGIVAFGGPLAEPETLRSELLLLPVALTLLSPLVAMLASPLFASMSRRHREGDFFHVERLAGVATAIVVAAVVVLGGLSWVVAGAIISGVAARQALLFVDETALRAQRAGRLTGDGPSILPVLVAAFALAAGHRMAGAYGVTLAALGMASAYTSASACGTARDLFAIRQGLPRRASDREAASGETAANLAVTLALLAASGPVLVAESVRRGTLVDLAVVAAPSTLLAAVVGAVVAAQWSTRFANAVGEEETVRTAAWTAAAAVALPALAGMVFGAGVAFGAALGLLAWAAAASPRAADAPMRPSVTLAWARTMALAALVAAPLMN